MLFDSSLYTSSTPNPRKERKFCNYTSVVFLHVVFSFFFSGVKFLADGELND